MQIYFLDANNRIEGKVVFGDSPDDWFDPGPMVSVYVSDPDEILIWGQRENWGLPDDGWMLYDGDGLQEVQKVLPHHVLSSVDTGEGRKGGVVVTARLILPEGMGAERWLRDVWKRRRPHNGGDE
jgi:hypothetical protein